MLRAFEFGCGFALGRALMPLGLMLFVALGAILFVGGCKVLDLFDAMRKK